MTSRTTLAAALALMLAATPAAAQRASLADRVATLEQRAANPQQTLDLLNQITQLRTELQALRGQLEEMQQANEQLRASLKNQYLDVDGRLQQLETRGAAPSPAPVAAADATTRPAVKAPPVPKPATPRPGIAPKPAPRPDAGSATPTGAELAAYNTAFDALKAGRYAEASSLFAQFIDRYPGGVYAPNALYWLGESYYATRDYARAVEPFSQLLDRFPTHDKAPGALLKLGLTRLNLHQDDAARAAFAEVAARYPDSDAARPATERLRAMGGAP
jgi:tol-pal system protein YbgF